MSSGELLWRAVRRHRGRMIAGVLVLSLHQATEAAVPVAIGIFVDRAVASGDVQPLLWCVLMMIVLFAVLSNAWKIGARQVVRAEGLAEVRDGLTTLVLTSSPALLGNSG